MGAQGTATLNFGAAAAKTVDAFVVVTGQAAYLSASSLAEAFMQGDSTADHSADEHVMAQQMLDLLVSDLVDATGFTIYATVREGAGLTGQFTVHWVWN